MAGIVQIPFGGFKLIDLGQSFALSAYQTLYGDHTEPVGLISVIQALGLLRPSDRAIDDFNEKWKRGTKRWKMRETGIEVVSGKSSTTSEMAKTQDGESTLIVLSYLIEALGSKFTADFSRQIIEKTPARLVPIKPRRTQVTNVVTAVESQTACISWQHEIDFAQESVCEKPLVWTSEMIIPPESFDVPLDGLREFYRVLCVISRFPDEYHCTVKTEASLVNLFVLARSICGLKVCVLVKGEVRFGNAKTGAWHVRLERTETAVDGQTSHKTEIKLGHKLEDAQDLLVIDEVGPLRANRISVNGIAKAATVSQGLSSSEGEELAALAIGAATSILERWKREVVDETGNEDASDVSIGASSEGSTEISAESSDSFKDRGIAPVKARVTLEAISTWWGCHSKIAIALLRDSEKVFPKQSGAASWAQLQFSGRIMGKIAEFEDLSEEEKVSKRIRTNHALDRRDFARVVHMLTTQLLLLTFLTGNNSAKDCIRVRSTCLPQNSILGRAIRAFESVNTMGQSDVLYSWYYWLHGSQPPEPQANYSFDVLTAEGYLVYRSLLSDFNLNPESCEMITVEPGHILSEDQRIPEIRGYDDGYSIQDKSHYYEQLKGRAKLRPSDHTGKLRLSWQVEVGDNSMDLTMSLNSDKTGFEFRGSVYQVAKESWKLHYGDRSIGCRHEEERVGTLAEGETLDVFSAGALPEKYRSPQWKRLVLLSAHGNDRGQIACLMSVEAGWHGMVKREACLRCCVTYCLKSGLDFLID
ncbi:uncharacterized protein FTOL_10129 [Fusarium torulosum]|uniref:Uncharacterized protein n=1 Tax=Fusarium torulosum TaxID=33205 RepID=A0AAE8MGD2_9HYPO|nr:uncharacterized protein FTOL_10129 [Fusarium torulosum]